MFPFHRRRKKAQSGLVMWLFLCPKSCKQRSWGSDPGTLIPVQEATQPLRTHTVRCVTSFFWFTNYCDPYVGLYISSSRSSIILDWPHNIPLNLYGFYNLPNPLVMADDAVSDAVPTWTNTHLYVCVCMCVFTHLSNYFYAIFLKVEMLGQSHALFPPPLGFNRLQLLGKGGCTWILFCTKHPCFIAKPLSLLPKG